MALCLSVVCSSVKNKPSEAYEAPQSTLTKVHIVYASQFLNTAYLFRG